MIGVFDTPHPLDDFARLRKEAEDTLRDTAIDLGLHFEIEDDQFIVMLPPTSDNDINITDPELD